jgi:putative PIN family toxin of toxin-antitoxin system
MRIVLDTNVFISGVFWKGPPSTVVDACSKGQVDLVLSPAIIEEYRRVGHDLADRYRSLDLDPIIDALVTAGSVVSDHELIARVCSDPDDDKFLAAAVAGRATFVISGDKALLRVREYHGVRIASARQFVDGYLKD